MRQLQYPFSTNLSPSLYLPPWSESSRLLLVFIHILHPFLTEHTAGACTLYLNVTASILVPSL